MASANFIRQIIKTRYPDLSTVVWYHDNDGRHSLVSARVEQSIPALPKDPKEYVHLCEQGHHIGNLSQVVFLQLEQLGTTSPLFCSPPLSSEA